MTNKEMLEADMLDILFENRNKEYGAYALRRGYDHRLLVSLGIAMSLIILLILLSSFGRKTTTGIKKPDDKGGMILKTYEIPKDKPKEPDMPKEKPGPATQNAVKPAASINYSSQIKIVPNETPIKNEMAEKEELVEKAIATTNTEGEKNKGLINTDLKPLAGPGNNGTTGIMKPEAAFMPLERNAEYPGGTEALRRFLSNNLATPDELEAGQKKMVRIRFKVDKDGNISDIEIEQSGGDMYDKEVLRVCKKMPRWKPALQNGTNVPDSYVLPVTFIGLEQ
jgi:periplasmic protein TonB